MSRIPEQYQQIGQLGKTYQLKGGLRFYTKLDDEVVLGLERVFIEGIGESDIRSTSRVGKDIIIYLTQALSPEQAQKLVNRRVYIHSELLPTDVHNDLIGFPVFLESQRFGHVVDIQEGLQDLLIVESKGKEFLIPLAANYVRIEADGIFLENVPEGLLE